MSETNEVKPEGAEIKEGEDEPRSSIAGPVWQLRGQASSTAALSPVSEIAQTLGESSIATPTTAKPKKSKLGE